ncbi:hypothetical protein BDZ89DRAFT_570125 [Hymenopellis radicata]|nr:hypothetical protein BDZ89DRAFT_570125 [Hymenopellis radicata]
MHAAHTVPTHLLFSDGWLRYHQRHCSRTQSTISFPGALPPTSSRQKHSSPRTRQITFLVAKDCSLRPRCITALVPISTPISWSPRHSLPSSVSLARFSRTTRSHRRYTFCCRLSWQTSRVKSQSGRIILRKDASISVWTALVLFLEGVLAWASLIDEA